jgi:ABC-type nitrate/sulfonate/bicarbonate transport system substrate-binding protein
MRPVGDEDCAAGVVTGPVQASLGSQGVIEGEKTGLKVIVAAADVIDSLPFAGVTTTLAKLKENPQQIKRVLRAGLRGLRYVQDNKAGTVDVLQSWYRIEHEVALSTYDLARKSFSTNAEVSEKGILLSMEFARTSGKFDKEVTPSEMTDFNLLREVKKELGWH